MARVRGWLRVAGYSRGWLARAAGGGGARRCNTTCIPTCELQLTMLQVATNCGTTAPLSLRYTPRTCAVAQLPSADGCKDTYACCLRHNLPALERNLCDGRGKKHRANEKRLAGIHAARHCLEPVYSRSSILLFNPLSETMVTRPHAKGLWDA